MSEASIVIKDDKDDKGSEKSKDVKDKDDKDSKGKDHKVPKQDAEILIDGEPIANWIQDNTTAYDDPDDSSESNGRSISETSSEGFGVASFKAY